MVHVRCVHGSCHELTDLDGLERIVVVREGVVGDLGLVAAGDGEMA